jgi:anti-sigma factor RsiW
MPMPESRCDFIEQGYAERYVLKELTAEARDRYEEHLFSCTACADEARAAVAFATGVREIYQDRKVGEWRFYAAVAALLAGTGLSLLCWSRKR